jgi:hypothetical protein
VEGEDVLFLLSRRIFVGLEGDEVVLDWLGNDGKNIHDFYLSSVVCCLLSVCGLWSVVCRLTLTLTITLILNLNPNS